MKKLAVLAFTFGVASFAFACTSITVVTIAPDAGDPNSTGLGSDGGANGNVGRGDGSPPIAVDAGAEVDGAVVALDAAVNEGCRKMDIVFVVDDSGSMATAQAKLKSNFPRMVDTLNMFKTRAGNNLDYRLAVTSTDTTRSLLATGGRGGFVTIPNTSCSPGAGGRAWLERTDSNVSTAFACRASLGVAGSATETPIDSLLLSVTDRLADQNQGFVRADALLAFFMLTDEEDSSTNTPQDAIQNLDQIKGARSRWAGAILSGPKAGQCSTTGHTAAQAPKLHAVVEGAADPISRKNNVIWRSICQETYDTAVNDALTTFTAACLNL